MWKTQSLAGLLRKVEASEKLCVVSLYDAASARLAALAGVDALLIGDSMASAVYACDVMEIRVEHMINHGKAVMNGLRQLNQKGSANPKVGQRLPLVVADLPFGSYLSPAEALKAATEIARQTGITSFKLEGGSQHLETTRQLAEAGLVVWGHIGLTPQSLGRLSGYRYQGMTAESAQLLLQEAKVLAQYCSFLVLECCSRPAAQMIAQSLKIPTIGIGSGPLTSGQVLVLSDLLGLGASDFYPGFTRQYAHLGHTFQKALSRFVQDVKTQRFPRFPHGRDFPAGRGEVPQTTQRHHEFQDIRDWIGQILGVPLEAGMAEPLEVSLVEWSRLCSHWQGLPIGVYLGGAEVDPEDLRRALARTPFLLFWSPLGAELPVGFNVEELGSNRAGVPLVLKMSHAECSRFTLRVLRQQPLDQLATRIFQILVQKPPHLYVCRGIQRDLAEQLIEDFQLNLRISD